MARLDRKTKIIHKKNNITNKGLRNLLVINIILSIALILKGCKIITDLLQKLSI